MSTPTSKEQRAVYLQRMIRARGLATELRSLLDEIVSDTRDGFHPRSADEYVIEDFASDVAGVEEYLDEHVPSDKFPSEDEEGWNV